MKKAERRFRSKVETDRGLEQLTRTERTEHIIEGALMKHKNMNWYQAVKGWWTDFIFIAKRTRFYLSHTWLTTKEIARHIVSFLPTTQSSIRHASAILKVVLLVLQIVNEVLKLPLSELSEHLFKIQWVNITCSEDVSQLPTQFA